MAQMAQAVSLPEPVSPPFWRRPLAWHVLLLVALVGWLYAPILAHLVRQWWADPNFSHGFFVPAFSLFLVWQERSRLRKITPAPSLWGLPIVLFSLCVLIVGVFGAELFLSRTSLLLLLAGLIVFFMGWQMLRALLFPLLFLVLMIPIPAIIFSQITFPLQILASRLSAWLLPVHHPSSPPWGPSLNKSRTACPGQFAIRFAAHHVLSSSL